ncbi:hypothetical protein NDN17_17595 [Shewanella algae]|uniref:hypothetical protein n=1 Tax=Shewanella algae TaxID=38313 RepID=UPI0011820DAE|nr:hypothetical protein [Shewanella algae]MCM2530318.1 hypothetical protein [Shewanella algae]
MNNRPKPNLVIWLLLLLLVTFPAIAPATAGTATLTQLNDQPPHQTLFKNQINETPTDHEPELQSTQ